MSSMVKQFTAFLLAGAGIAYPSLVAAQDGSSWDRNRAQLVAESPGRIAQAITRWEYLDGRDNLSFDEYAGFVTSYPGFPREERMRRRAEAALDRSAVRPEAVVAFFDRNPPLTNAGRARYALALSALGRPEALGMARSAWRGGAMSSAAEAYMQGLFGPQFAAEDHDARMDALLWQAETDAATRQLVRVSPSYRSLATARLALLNGGAASAGSAGTPPGAMGQAGYVYNLARHYRTSGRMAQAIDLFATRAPFAAPAFDAEDYIAEALRAARSAGSEPAVRIASNVDDLFAANTDISALSYGLRDDYTSLMWLGGTKALWELGDGRRAAPLFYRYGAAARTPQTRSKGFYWAALAARRAGDQAGASRYLEMAAQYPDRFYGQLALADLRRPFPTIAPDATIPDAQARQAFRARPIVAAVREVARGAPWSTGIQFYRALADSADTPAEHALNAELAREIGRRDLAVNVAEAAGADGHSGFVVQGFPIMPTPGGTDWTMVHAITRQESQFAQNAISHAGARGLMQLMPGTAREQAGKLGINYMSADLIDSPSYNIQLGDGYFRRMLSYYGGAYPLAVAAYNAGPGNVNKWLRANGDPRTGAIGYVEWIEKIPIFETKNYVHRVLENAATYEQLHPDRAPAKRARLVGDFLR